MRVACLLCLTRCAVGLWQAAQEELTTFKRRYTELCAEVVREAGRAREVPPNDMVLPLSGLIFCISKIAGTVGAFMGSLHQLGVVLRTGYVMDAVREVEGSYLLHTNQRVQSGFSSSQDLDAQGEEGGEVDGTCSRCKAQVVEGAGATL